MSPECLAARSDLVTLTKSDADPMVRHRAHVLLASLDASSFRAAADACAVSYDSLHRWWGRFLTEGRDGLADRPRPGRPRKLSEEALVLLRRAVAAAPEDYGYPVTTWTIADLTDLLRRKGWEVGITTVQRALHAEGYVYRRPRHDLAHRQDAEAVASAAHVLETLQKKGLLSPTDCTSSISTNARFTPTPTWIAAGNDADAPPGSPPPEPTSA